MGDVLKARIETLGTKLFCAGLLLLYAACSHKVDYLDSDYPNLEPKKFLFLIILFFFAIFIAPLGR